MKKLIICLILSLISSCSFRKPKSLIINYIQQECTFYEIIEDHFLHNAPRETREKIGRNNAKACKNCEKLRNSEKCNKILKEIKASIRKKSLEKYETKRI